MSVKGLAEAVVAGVGLTPVTSPRRQELSNSELCRQAIAAALQHSGCAAADIDAVVYGSIPAFEGTVAGARTVVPALGLQMGIPVTSVNTGGTTGGNLVNVATDLVRAGIYERVLCVGPSSFDGAADMQAVTRTGSPVVMEQPLGLGAVHMGAFFPAAYLAAYGATVEDLAELTAKNRENAVHNPYMQLREPVTAAQVLSARPLSTPLTLAMVCPVSSGACAVLVTSERVARDLANPVVRVSAHGSIGDSYLGGGRGDFATFAPAAVLAERLYRIAHVNDPCTDLDAIELFCPYAPMEFLLLEALGICAPGGAPELLREGVTRFGGALPVNVSGSSLCGNPGVAAELAPYAYLALQLMGQAAGGRQVRDARRGIAHSTGGTFFQFHTLAVLERI